MQEKSYIKPLLSLLVPPQPPVLTKINMPLNKEIQPNHLYDNVVRLYSHTF